MKKRYFVSGIGTDVGKTVVSAILVEALKADYWKPIQAGDLEDTDTEVVKKLISNNKSRFFPEAYKFKTPASPHYAASKENIEIDIDKIVVPQTDNHLIIEGAGGVMVPLNNDSLILDLIEKIGAELILVSQNYLGSINHTLLTIDVLQKRGVPIKGIIFNGESNPSTEEYILTYSKLKCLGRINQEKVVDDVMIRRCGDVMISRLVD